MEFKVKAPLSAGCDMYGPAIKWRGVYRRKISRYSITENPRKVYTYSKYKLPFFSAVSRRNRAIPGKFFVDSAPIPLYNILRVVAHKRATPVEKVYCGGGKPTAVE
jgi:hypothetical protein